MVPGGFGDRGVEGKIMAAQYAREHKIPYLGLCYGMQMAVIEFARHVLGLAERQQHRDRPARPAPGDRHHARPARHRRHGRHDAPGPLPLQAGARHASRRGLRRDEVYERHRHRFEFNNAYRERARSTPAWSSAGSRPMAGWSRSSSCATIRGSSPAQFHPELQDRARPPAPALPRVHRRRHSRACQ